MAYSCSSSSVKKLINVRIQGILHINEVLNGIKKVTFPGHIQTDFKILVEIRDVQFRPTAAEVKQIAELIVELKKTFANKTALIVPSKFLFQMANLAKYYIQKRTNIEMEVFDNAKEAVSWLNE